MPLLRPSCLQPSHSCLQTLRAPLLLPACSVFGALHAPRVDCVPPLGCCVVLAAVCVGAAPALPPSSDACPRPAQPRSPAPPVLQCPLSKSRATCSTCRCPRWTSGFPGDNVPPQGLSLAALRRWAMLIPASRRRERFAPLPTHDTFVRMLSLRGCSAAHPHFVPIPHTYLHASPAAPAVHLLSCICPPSLYFAHLTHSASM